MKDIQKYLEKQLEVSNELNQILRQVDTLEDIEKELLYKENEKLLIQLKCVNDANITATNDRVEVLKGRVNNLLSLDSTNKDPHFKKYLTDFNNELNNLSNKLIYLDNNLTQMNDRHKGIVNNSEKNTVPNIQVNTKKQVINEHKNKQQKIKSEDKFEFKIGSNILNIIGVVLILIALITFGKYIYSNFMTDAIKGIFLFAVSSIILLLGEGVLKKTVPKYATRISALGVGSLYASLIINYLVLDTINSIFAIVLTLVITGISMWISSTNNSDIIRIIALIGGYGCLMPMDYLYGVESYVTIVMLLIISIANSYMPIKNSKFLIYSSMFSTLFSINVMTTGFLEDNAVFIYVMASIIFNNFMFIKTSKEYNSENYHICALLTTGIMMFLGCDGITVSIALICIGYILISAISYHLAPYKLKSAYYTHAIVTAICLVNEYLMDIKGVHAVAVSMLTVLTIYIYLQLKDKCMNIVSILVTIFALNTFVFSECLVDTIIYMIVFSGLIWLLSDKYKNNKSLVALKHAFFGCVILISIWDLPLEENYCVLLAVALSVVYVLIQTHIEKLRHSTFKESNNIILIGALISANIFIGYDLLNTVISISLSAIILLLLINTNYVEKESIQKHKYLICSLYSTYSIFMLFGESGIDYGVNNLILSVVLMLFAFVNVWVGFKLNTLEVRKYGLILSLIVCAKLILIDFYSLDFMLKTGLFLIVGVVALVISYIYSKLEQELNNKNNDNK